MHIRDPISCEWITIIEKNNDISASFNGPGRVKFILRVTCKFIISSLLFSNASILSELWIECRNTKRIYFRSLNQLNASVRHTRTDWCVSWLLQLEYYELISVWIFDRNGSTIVLRLLTAKQFRENIYDCAPDTGRVLIPLVHIRHWNFSAREFSFIKSVHMICTESPSSSTSTAPAQRHRHWIDTIFHSCAISLLCATDD